jgi:LmbE family N-acetylglucosaminyl deacetylase
LPDGSVAEHESALADELSDRLSDTSLCIATWYLDGHPDHDAVGRAARAATERTGARLLSYPLWMWHWSRPGDPSVPWGRLHRLKLPARTVAIKRAAATRFVTQVRPLSPRPEDAPVLPEPVLRRLLRDYEVFVG